MAMRYACFRTVATSRRGGAEGHCVLCPCVSTKDGLSPL